MPSTVGFYAVKVTAIFLISILYFIVGSVLSILLNSVIPDEDLHQISTPLLFILLGGIFGTIGVVFYLLRISIKRMPFFLDGYYGFQYSMLKEAMGDLTFAYTMYAYLDKLKGLMGELSKRLRGEEKGQEKGGEKGMREQKDYA